MSFQSELLAALEQADIPFEDAQILLEYLTDIHRDLEALLVSSGLYAPAQAQELLNGFNRIITRHNQDIVQTYATLLAAASVTGASATNRLLASVEMEWAVGVTPWQQSIIEQYLTVDRVVAVTDEMRAGLKAEILAGFLNGRNPYEVMKRIEDLWGIRSTFPKIGKTGISAKVERIVRTELLTALNGSKYAQIMQAAERWKDLKRVWIATGDSRTRDSHLVAHGQVVAADEPFVVGGSFGMFPGDPSLPIQERASCRCTVVPYREVWGSLDELIAPATQYVEKERKHREQNS